MLQAILTCHTHTPDHILKHVPAAQIHGGANFNPVLPTVGGGAYSLTLMGQQRATKHEDDEWTRRRKAAGIVVVFGYLIRRNLHSRHAHEPL